MSLRSQVLVVFTLATLVASTDSRSALAQGRNRRSFERPGNNNPGDTRQDGNRRKRDREDDGNQQLQNLIQGGHNGSENQSDSGSSQQPRHRNQQLQQLFQDGQHKQGQNWQSRRFDHHNELQSWIVGFNGGPRPFSSEWYEHHPHAWHHHHRHDDDYWKVATAATVFGWLNWQAQPYRQTTIVYDPVPVETVIVDGQPSGVDPDAAGEWLTLGAYTLVTGAGDPGTRVLELSIDKQSRVRGSYYDMITDATQNVYGVIDQSTQQLRWTLDTNRQLTFVATLDQLTQPQGVVHVKLPGGQVQQWQLVRMESTSN